MAISTPLYELTSAAKNYIYLTMSEDEDLRRTAEDGLLAIREVIDDKVADCCAAVKNLRATSAVLAAEIERLTAKKKFVEERLEWLEHYVGLCLDGQKWSNGIHTIGWRKSEAVEIPDIDLVPLQYKRSKTEWIPDKKAIALDLKNGATLSWARLQARNNIQIK